MSIEQKMIKNEFAKLVNNEELPPTFSQTRGLQSQSIR
jgi:hypothetical protein